MPKRNVTLTLDEEVARWARVAAAHRNTSVSRFLGDLLRQGMRGEQDYAKAMKRYLSRRPVKLSSSARYPTRDEVHARGRVR